MKKQPTPPDEYCPECMSLKRKPNKECVNHDKYWIKKDECPGCGFKYGGILRIHNMNGECPIMSNLKVEPILKQIKEKSLDVSIDEFALLMVKTIANKHIVVQDTHEGRIAQRYWYKEAQKMLKKLVKEYERVCKEEYNK